MGELVLPLLLCPAIHWHTPRASPRPDEIGCDGDDYENLATLVAVAIAAFAKQKDTLLLLVSVEDEDSRRVGHIVVDARDRRSEGKTTLIA